VSWALADKCNIRYACIYSAAEESDELSRCASSSLYAKPLCIMYCHWTVGKSRSMWYGAPLLFYFGALWLRQWCHSSGCSFGRWCFHTQWHIAQHAQQESQLIGQRLLEPDSETLATVVPCLSALRVCQSCCKSRAEALYTTAYMFYTPQITRKQPRQLLFANRQILSLQQMSRWCQKVLMPLAIADGAALPLYFPPLLPLGVPGVSLWVLSWYKTRP